MLALPADGQSVDRLADWIETTVVFGQSGSVALAQILDWLEEEGAAADLELYDSVGDPDLGGLTEPEAMAHIRSDSAEGIGPGAAAAHDAFLKLQYRSEIVGSAYPIGLQGTVALRKEASWTDSPVYAFLLALNARHFHHLDANFHTGARLFERLVVLALARYWGGESVHFGWPRDPGEATGFRTAFPALVRRMRERLTREPSDLPGRLKDFSVDVAAWRPLDDRRGQSIMLCQCAIGADWEDKGLHVEEWERMITFAVAPIKSLAFPFTPEAERTYTDVEWELLAARGGVPFDRLRLAQLAPEVDEPLRSELVEWTTSLAVHLGD